LGEGPKTRPFEGADSKEKNRQKGGTCPLSPDSCQKGGKNLSTFLPKGGKGIKISEKDAKVHVHGGREGATEILQEGKKIFNAITQL